MASVSLTLQTEGNQLTLPVSPGLIATVGLIPNGTMTLTPYYSVDGVTFIACTVSDVAGNIYSTIGLTEVSTPVSYQFMTPVNTTAVRIAVTSYSSGTVQAQLSALAGSQSINVNVMAGAVAISAGTASVSTGTVVLSNSNGLSFGLNGSVITASAAAESIAFSAGTVSANLNSLVFSNTNGVSLAYQVPPSPLRQPVEAVEARRCRRVRSL